jgi:multimeric flavodoxin WrbA
VEPNDENGKKPTNERPFRVLVIAGSDRRQYNCPGVDSKARALALRIAERMPDDWEVDVEDLGNVYKRPTIASCNACVSTSMALCVWPCNCYEKDGPEPDLMWDLDMYARLDLADAWIIVGPVNWYAPSSNLKLMFDRLVCMNGGNPREDLIKHKDPELAMRLERSEEWKELSVNHLEGRTAAFFCYGDGGGDELDASGRPKKLLHKEWFDPEHEPFEDMRDTYAPLVWQCRYSGIEVPDDLWTYVEFGRDKPYSLNQAEHMAADPAAPLTEAEAFASRVVHRVAAKGKVEPGKYRAFGHRAPRHAYADLRLAWREARMRIGKPKEGSSPAAQQAAGLNDDVTLTPKEGEGEKRRQD